ncbi:MAG TPA: hypothetical protein VI455_01290 [Terriglobia bacterium]
MDAGILVPLGCFAMVVLIVALTSFAKIHDRETDTLSALGRAEAEHRARLAELDLELQRLKQRG